MKIHKNNHRICNERTIDFVRNHKQIEKQLYIYFQFYERDRKFEKIQPHNIKKREITTFFSYLNDESRRFTIDNREMQKWKRRRQARYRGTRRARNILCNHNVRTKF